MTLLNKQRSFKQSAPKPAAYKELDVQALVLSHEPPREKAQKLVAFYARPNAPKPDIKLLKRLDLSHADLRGIKLRVLGPALRFVNLTNANLALQDFSHLDLHDAMMEGADLRGANFAKANLQNANLSRSFLGRAAFFNSDARGINMTGARAPRAYMDMAAQGAQMGGLQAPGLVLGVTNFAHAKMRDADLSGAVAEHEGVNFTQADLSGTNLCGDFRYADFTAATMVGTKMEGGNFEAATFGKALMSGASAQPTRDGSRPLNRYAALGHNVVPMAQAMRPQPTASARTSAQALTA